MVVKETFAVRHASPLLGVEADHEEGLQGASPPEGEESLPGVLQASADMLEFMAKVGIFDGLPKHELLELARVFTTRHAGDGQLIIKQYEAADGLFFIEQGAVSVRIKTGRNDEESEIASLAQGQYFGEVALLTGAGRSASVYAVGNVKLRVISKQDFDGCGLKSRLALGIKHAELDKNGLRKLFRAVPSCRNLAKAVLILATYFGLATFVFCQLEGWSLVDSVYFSVVTLTAVGYGDIVPTHPASRLFVVIFVLSASVTLALSLGGFLETLVTLEIKNEKARKALQLQPRAVDVFDQEGQRYHWRDRFCGCLGVVAVLICVGAVTARYALHVTVNWGEAFYFSVVTLATIGYGDVVPTTESDKWIVSVMCLVGVPLFATVLAKMVEIAYGRARFDQMKTVLGGLTHETFHLLVQFGDAMWRAGAYNSKPQQCRREQVSPFEFLCFILIKNENVTLEDIKVVMDNFSKLDTTGSGFLELDDVEEWLKRSPSSTNDSSGSVGQEGLQQRELAVFSR